MAIEIDTITAITSGDDLKIYENEKSFRVFAGPGAGKTHLLIENIKALIKHSDKLKKDGRKILCITYTNAAVDEIKRRLGTFNKYAYVSTIHSFLYDAVIKSHMKQLRYLIRTQYGIELSNKTKLQPRVEGMNLLAMCKKEKLQKYLRNTRQIDENKLAKLSKTKMADCIWDISEINIYPFNSDAAVPIIQIEDKTNKINYSKDECKVIKSAILEVANELDFDEILYWGYSLIKQYKHIKYLLKYRFPYVLVDEYQDTNPIQNETIKLFADDDNVVWGVIGDLAQSIYGFQGATYKEFENFKTAQKQIDYKIEGNRRSTQNIVSFCSYFRQHDSTLPTQTCIKNFDTNTKVKIVLHTSASQANTLFAYDEKTAFLCRSAAEAFTFTNIDDEQKKALKKIADTYQFSRGYDMINLIGQNREQWLELCQLVVAIKNAKQKGSLAGVMFACEKVLDLSKTTKSSVEQKKYYKNLLAFIKNFDIIAPTSTFKDIEDNINAWLTVTEMFKREPFNIPKENDEFYNKEIHDNIRKLTYGTIEKMIKDIFTENSKIMTIHKAKGLQFDKVIVGIEPFGRQENFIKKLDILKDPYIFSQNATLTENDKAFAEFTRILYVGFSRAKNELTLYIKLEPTEKENFKNEFDAKLKSYMTA
jgi:superfamily I DNA/RNA helicase